MPHTVVRCSDSDRIPLAPRTSWSTGDTVAHGIGGSSIPSSSSGSPFEPSGSCSPRQNLRTVELQIARHPHPRPRPHRPQPEATFADASRVYWPPHGLLIACRSTDHSPRLPQHQTLLDDARSIRSDCAPPSPQPGTHQSCPARGSTSAAGVRWQGRGRRCPIAAAQGRG